MTKSKLFSIITIACFASILCIPIGVVLMLYYTDWKKKTKIILSISLTAFYAALIAFFLLVKPSVNTSGISLPFGSNSGYTAFDSGSGGSGSSKGGRSSSSKSKQNSGAERLPKSVQNSQKKGLGNAIYPILFFGFMLLIIIIQNLRSKGKSNYENPYVDTNKYKLPFTTDSKMPMVHFLHVELAPEEKINYATETNQKDNEGNFVITNRRVIIQTKTENTELPIETIDAIASTTSTVLSITAQEKKYYIFMPENQMKYAIAVLKWTAKK